MKHTNKLTAVMAMVAFALAIVVQPVQAQDVIPAVQTRVAEVKEKAQALGADREAVDEAVTEMQQFRGQLQSHLESIVDPELLAVPTTIPKGRGNRVKVCLDRSFDRWSRTWTCVKWGR